MEMRRSRNRSNRVFFDARRSVTNALALIVLLVGTTGCSSLYPHLRSFDADFHDSAAMEWQPHYGVAEWWYATGYLSDASGDKLFLYQFTIFHVARGLLNGYILDLALTDYESSHHIFEERSAPGTRKVFGEPGRIVFRQNSISLDGDTIRIAADGEKLDFELVLVSRKAPVWHDLDGIIPMGHPGKPSERSFYYSFTNMDTTGRIAYTGSDGAEYELAVTGKSWFDRQWGAFTETGWDWFSLRFFDDTEAMLFVFPSGGFKGATWIGNDGEARYYWDFDYSVEEWMFFDGRRYGIGWTVDLPFAGGRYELRPLYRGDFNPNLVYNYWEGLCEILNEEGQLVGYCVTETTSRAHPE